MQSAAGWCAQEEAANQVSVLVTQSLRLIEAHRGEDMNRAGAETYLGWTFAIRYATEAPARYRRAAKGEGYTKRSS